MTTIKVERVIIVVISIENLDSIDKNTVAGQIVLHPAARVFQRNALDSNVFALNETQQMGTGDAFIIPGMFLESPSSAINSTIPVDGDILHLVGIDQLDGVGLRAQ